MTIYSFNLGIGWASSGVEYAQAYRAQILRRLHQPAKFVFTDLILHENIANYTRNIGFKDQEVIWLYQYFTDLKISPNCYSLPDFESTIRIKTRRTRIERVNDKIIRYHFPDDSQFVTVYLKDGNSRMVAPAEYVSRNCLIRKDYFTYTKAMSEYYTPRDHRAYVYLRRFFNEDGSIAYEQLVDGQSEMYRFPNHIFYSKSAFFRYFLQKLALKPHDICLLDRSTEIGPDLFRHHGQAKLGVVIHAEHYNPASTDDQHILWNNYYDYQFTNVSEVAFFITATQKQKTLLARQFKHYQGKAPQIFAIPVGGLSHLVHPAQKRWPCSLITASRLAEEKHVDQLILAVVAVKKRLPQLTLDIYGEGGQKDKLKKLIETLKATDYIHLKGHHQLANRYAHYQAYLSASTSEGFGLSLMEAVGSGLAMIGLNVRYGNQTFILDQQNGYLLSYQETEDLSDTISHLAQAIQNLFSQSDLEAFHRVSYQIAQAYLLPQVAQKWQLLLEAMSNA